MYIKQIVNDRLRLRNIAYWVGKSNRKKITNVCKGRIFFLWICGSCSIKYMHLVLICYLRYKSQAPPPPSSSAYFISGFLDYMYDHYPSTVIK